MEINESRARGASGVMGLIAVLLVAFPMVALVAGRGDDMEEKRNRMVEEQIERRGVEDPRVLGAMRQVERHRFVPDDAVAYAYDDSPLRIGHGQTISQPYIVALMTELLEPQPDDRVLEIGTGSGYQAAVLSLLVAEVYSIEIVEPLGESARAHLDSLGYDNVQVRIGDGYQGWPEHAPFDKIIVTAAPDHVPPALLEQLAEGGRMVLPVGDAYQHLVLLTRTDGVIEERRITAVRFVPMVRGLGSIKSYIRQLRSGEYRASFGHSPLAVLGVFALLLALATQVATGLFSVDVDGLESGPLAVLVSFDTGRQLAEIHELNFNLLAVLIALHVTAVALYHFVLKANLVGPMITGRRFRTDFPGNTIPRNHTRPLPMAVAIVLSLACVFAISNFG